MHSKLKKNKLQHNPNSFKCQTIFINVIFFYCHQTKTNPMHKSVYPLCCVETKNFTA